MSILHLNIVLPKVICGFGFENQCLMNSFFDSYLFLPTDQKVTCNYKDVWVWINLEILT